MGNGYLFSNNVIIVGFNGFFNGIILIKDWITFNYFLFKSKLRRLYDGVIILKIWKYIFYNII